MNYTYSVDKNGTIYRLHAEDDPDPTNPRRDDEGNIGTMYCEHNRYRLGDKTDLKSKLDMKYRMIEDAGVSNHGHLAQPPALLVVWINPSGVRCDSA